MNIAETSLKVLLFNGKASTFEYWGPKFEARAQKKKTSPIFLGCIVIPSETAYEVEQTLKRKLSKILTLIVRLMII